MQFITLLAQCQLCYIALPELLKCVIIWTIVIVLILPYTAV